MDAASQCLSVLSKRILCSKKKKKKERNIYTSKDNKLLLKRTRLILLESTLKTRPRTIRPNKYTVFER